MMAFMKIGIQVFAIIVLNGKLYNFGLAVAFFIFVIFRSVKFYDIKLLNNNVGFQGFVKQR